MFKRIAAIAVIALAIGLQSCLSSTVGFNKYVDSYNGFRFLYPNGWVEVTVPDGPDVVLHDIIEPSENVSVIINEVPDGKTLRDLGSPSDVGQKMAKRGLSADNEAAAELVTAGSRQTDEGEYYLLEYQVDLPEGIRHNLASVVVRRGQLFTFSASTTDNRWKTMEDRLRKAVSSFSVY
ncbi:MAG: photosystem II reaction center PsbP [Elainellaceae cyanobacterium]